MRQFIDIGAGIPGAGSTHELVQEIDPQARVAYVDIDPVAVLLVAVLHLLADADQPGRVTAALRDARSAPAATW